MDSVLVFFFIRVLLARDFKPPALEDSFGVSGFTGFVWTGGRVVRGVASFRLVVGLHGPHQHFDLLCFLVHPPKA